VKKTKVINLFGGSCIGKSTTAAELFVALKKQSKSVELVQEYVKEWAWQKRTISQFDQVFITAEQIRRETQLYGKVDYIITDCPLSLGLCYSKARSPDVYEGLKLVVKQVMEIASKNGVEYKNYILNREKKYIAEGRYETEEQAKKMDDTIHTYLASTAQEYVHLKYSRVERMPLDMSQADLIIKSLGIDESLDSFNKWAETNPPKKTDFKALRKKVGR